MSGPRWSILTGLRPTHPLFLRDEDGLGLGGLWAPTPATAGAPSSIVQELYDPLRRTEEERDLTVIGRSNPRLLSLSPEPLLAWLGRSSKRLDRSFVAWSGPNRADDSSVRPPWRASFWTLALAARIEAASGRSCTAQCFGPKVHNSVVTFMARDP